MTPPSAVDRFDVDLARLAGNGPMGVAVSGGPDSMALLHLAVAARPGKVAVATVDHGLRPEAAGEAALVARACARLGVPHSILKVDVARQASIQAAARAARYEALAAWCRDAGLGILATAHHADDQAETMLMRLARGAGLSGLSGIRAARDLGGVLLVRPLLGWRRGELATIVAGHETVDDPSNRDARHDRTWARSSLAMIGDRIDPLRLAASAAHLGEADIALEWLVDEAIRTRASEAGNGRTAVDLEGLPRDLCRRIVARLVGQADSPVDGPALDMALARLDAGQFATLGMAKLSPGRRITIEKAPARR